MKIKTPPSIVFVLEMLIAETPHEQATTRHMTALPYSILSLFSLLIYTIRA